MLPFPRCDGPCGPQGIRYTAAAPADAEWSHLGADPQGALGLCANGTTGGALLSTVAFFCLFSFFCFYFLGNCECEVEVLGVFLFVDVNLCFLLNFGHSFFSIIVSYFLWKELWESCSLLGVLSLSRWAVAFKLKTGGIQCSNHVHRLGASWCRPCCWSWTGHVGKLRCRIFDIDLDDLFEHMELRLASQSEEESDFDLDIFWIKMLFCLNVAPSRDLVFFHVFCKKDVKRVGALLPEDRRGAWCRTHRFPSSLHSNQVIGSLQFSFT